MRALAEPAVLRNAIIAAAGSALACFPRFRAWEARLYPVWYLEAILFLGAIVLWAFVFAWHSRYSGQPIFSVRPPRRPLLLATIAGSLGGVLQRFYFDPVLKAHAPGDFPANLGQWLALLLFSVAFVDLFVVFAPFDWALRLFRSPPVAAIVTIAFGIFVLWLKQKGQQLPASFVALLFCSRAIAAVLSVYLYLRAGVLLVWWCHFLMQARHLLFPFH